MEASGITHLGCIMDGNRRWALKNGLRAWLGHREGIEAVKKTVAFCLEHQIKFLTLYTFSIENFQRSSDELTYLFSTIAQAMHQYVPELIAKGVRVQFIGDRSLFPQSLRDDCALTEEQTKQLDTLTLNMLFCYGGQQEIYQAVQSIAERIDNKTLSLNELSPHFFEQQLWMGGIPKPELIIRTGGIKRLSNFLLYHAAYAELFFLDYLWPELTKEHLEEVLIEYKKIKRNFGT